MEGIDMELQQQTESAATDFHNDSPMPNIWAINDEDEARTEENAAKPVVSNHEEDELERPSFLRRLRSRNKADADDTQNPDTDKTAE